MTAFISNRYFCNKSAGYSVGIYPICVRVITTIG